MTVSIRKIQNQHNFPCRRVCSMSD